VKRDPRKRIGRLVGTIRVINAWIGYSDGRPYVYFNDYHQAEWCVFTNRADARKAFADVRKVRLNIAEITK
jgi:hypothetical protein